MKLSIPSGLVGPVKSFVPKFANSPLVKTVITEVADQYGFNIPLYYGGIYNKLTDTLIPFLLPEEVSRSHSASIDDVSAETRSIGMPYYTGGGSPEVSFEVYLNDDFYNLMVQRGLLGVTVPTQYIGKAVNLMNGSTINEVISCMRALTFPEYDRGVAKSPECIIFLGESACYLARCTSVSDTMKGITGLNRDAKFTYREATVSLSFTILKEVSIKGNYNVPSASDIQSGQGGMISMY